MHAAAWGSSTGTRVVRARVRLPCSSMDRKPTHTNSHSSHFHIMDASHRAHHASAEHQDLQACSMQPCDTSSAIYIGTERAPSREASHLRASSITAFDQATTQAHCQAHLVSSAAPAASRSPSALPARLAGALPAGPNPSPAPTPLSVGAIAPPAALTMRGTRAMASDGWLATRFSFSMKLSRRWPPLLLSPPPSLRPAAPAETLRGGPGTPLAPASSPPLRRHGSAGFALVRASGGRAALLGTVLPARPCESFSAPRVMWARDLEP